MKGSIKKFKTSYLLSIITYVVLFSSCHKEGIGGKSSVSGKVMHHTALIPYSVVYIKYGTTEFPGSNLSLYDDKTTSDANANYEIKNLRKGDYYLYGVGFDNSISETVTGGIAVKLKYNQTVTSDVPVVE